MTTTIIQYYCYHNVDIDDNNSKIMEIDQWFQLLFL